MGAPRRQNKAMGARNAFEDALYEADEQTVSDFLADYVVRNVLNPNIPEEEKVERLSELFNGIGGSSVIGSDEDYDDIYDESYEDIYGDYEGGIDDDPAFEPKIVEDTGVSLSNVGGIREVKEELKQVIDFLKDPKPHIRLGGKLPRGVLLKGPPGTGKTLLAKMMAHEARVPFISVAGTEFDASVHGVGPARIRKLMGMAVQQVRDMRDEGHPNPACIVFIDEIDVFGRKRGVGRDSHQEVMMELARLMDGFDTEDGITVIATTNRPDVLDPALMRPGRFDKPLVVPAPDMKGRKEILDIIVRERKMPLKVDVDLEAIAKKTPGFAGADLNLLVNEAAFCAARRPNARKVGMADFLAGYDRVLKGPRVNLNMSREERESTAVHEAGHAIAGLRLEKQGMSKLRSVTILPHTGSLGTTYFTDDKEVYSHTLEKFKAELVVDFAGRVAEELVYGPEKVSSGASGDIDHATLLAWKMVTHFGFNKDLGYLRYDLDDGADSYLGGSSGARDKLDPDTARKVMKEMKAITDEAYELARKLLTEDYEALIALSESLLIHETRDREQVIEVTKIDPEEYRLPRLKQIANRGPHPDAVYKPK